MIKITPAYYIWFENKIVKYNLKVSEYKVSNMAKIVPLRKEAE
jgi:hypothetical protein